MRIERPINKDTELHPLARWQFQGGLQEDQRRAFLFTNVTGSDGQKLRHAGRDRRARGVAREIYALGMGRPVDEIGDAWLQRDQPSDPAGRGEIGAVPGGRDQGRRAAQARRRAEALAGADLDARFRCRALSHRDVLHHQGPGDRRPQHGHLSGAAESDATGSACAWRRGSAAPAAICIGRNTAS